MSVLTGGVLEAVRNLLPELQADVDRCERERSVSDEAIRALAEAGVFRIFQPRRYGGFEGDLQLFFDVIATVGRASASIGWVAGVLGTHQWVAAAFSERAQDDVWGTAPDSLVTATEAPGDAVAEPVPGGFRVNGTWHFASGCKHSSWHFVGATIRNAGIEPPERAYFLLPVGDVTFVDNWFVNGLCGTASYDALVTNAFVPEHRVLWLRDIISGQTPGRSVNAAPLYRLPNATVVALGIMAPVVGATAEALSIFIAANRTRIRGGGVMGDPRKMAESPALQKAVAEASTLLDAVNALIAQDIRATEAATLDDRLTVEARIRNRRDDAYAVRLCMQIMTSIYENSGTEAMFPPNPLERTWRDVHAAAKHVGLNWDNTGTMAGRHLLGLEPRGQF